MSTMDYIFTSQRLGFRNWQNTDLPKMAAINADEEVMHYFPAIQSEAKTEEFVKRMQVQFEKKGFCYFAVDKLDTSEFIGFIGLSEQTYEADFTPCVVIGWRLAKRFWGKGYATEGAKAVLNFGFTQLKLSSIVAVAPIINLASIGVMQKIGMRKVKTFEHSLLKDFERLKECALYQIKFRINK